MLPPPSLRVTQERAEKSINRLLIVRNDMRDLPARTQYLLAEILLIRLASVLEDFISESALKIACGTVYIDGSTAALRYQARSMADARNAMLTRNRARTVPNLRWTRAKYIRESVQHVIEPFDHFVETCEHFGATWAELFKVRTFAAHRSTSSRENFKSVIRNTYGQMRKMELGQFLLSPQWVERPNIDRYALTAQVFVKQLVRAT